ncbi:MAG: hypothetical protein H6964_11280 [Chromatiaceae bacterium]|nr:hypothetical protein [Gammaproteobacteria bacterium]MCP5427599.1 hypothetical protein [Chromatiaceae bacterium]MCP5447564.1 hypothetical protein [Chromatiaceae bacterium]
MALVGYYASRYQAGLGSQELQSVVRLQQERINELERIRLESAEKLAVLERSSQIDQEAVRKVRDELKNYQQERLQLDEELTFLRSMVSTKDDREGVQIHRFSLKKGDGEGVFQYRFTVTQSMNNGDTASGWAFLAVDGLKEGEPMWLPLREMTKEKTERIKVRFNQFQDIEGIIQLPENFKPLKVIVEVKPSNKNLPEVKQRFDWVVKG